MKLHDLAGQRFGRLIVVTRDEQRLAPPHWVCLCDCGTKKVIMGASLRKGLTKSCGCFCKENSKKLGQATKKHGLERHPLYATWSGMVARCTHPENTSYERYGGRGITVCEQWMSVTNFIEDMGPKPSPEHSIERIDNNGPYSPENCIWATRKEQTRNRRSNIRLTYNGETKTLVEWSEHLGLPRYVLANRYKRGWAVHDILYTPQRRNSIEYHAFLKKHR